MSPNRDSTALLAVTWAVLGRGDWHFLLHVHLHLLSPAACTGDNSRGKRRKERGGLNLHVIAFGDALENWLTQATTWDRIFLDLSIWEGKDVVRRNVYCLFPIDNEERHDPNPVWSLTSAFKINWLLEPCMCWTVSAVLTPFALPAIVNRHSLFPSSFSPSAPL